MSRRRGSARMLRLPSARAPHSMRPWNQPTMSPAARRRGRGLAQRGFIGQRRPRGAPLLDDLARRGSPRAMVSASYSVPQYECSMRELIARRPVACHASSAAPSAVPLSPAAGWMKTCLERRVRPDLSVGDAVHRAPAGEAQCVRRNARVCAAQDVERRRLRYTRCTDAAMFSCTAAHRFVGAPCRTEQIDQAIACRHPAPSAHRNPSSS